MPFPTGDFPLGNAEQIARIASDFRRHVAPRHDAAFFFVIFKRVAQKSPVIRVIEDGIHTLKIQGGGNFPEMRSVKFVVAVYNGR